jgi:hypothetical protein
MVETEYDSSVSRASPVGPVISAKPLIRTGWQIGFGPYPETELPIVSHSQKPSGFPERCTDLGDALPF